MTAHRLLTEEPALEARFAGMVAAALNRQTEALPHDITERLRAGREQALGRARRQPVQVSQAAGAVAALGTTASGAAILGGRPSWSLRLMSGLPVLLLVAGLILIERWNGVQQVRAAAEVDAQLLADALPPTAYTDPGFAEYLRSARPEQP